MPDCRHCDEPIPGNFDVCWNCGVPAHGAYDPVDFPLRSGSNAPPVVAPDVEPRSPFRFRLIHLFILTTLVAILAACSTSDAAMFILSAVLITNFIGVLIGIFVTNIWGLPNDGSDREYRQDDAE